MSMKFCQPLSQVTRKNCAKFQEKILRSRPCRRWRVKFGLPTPSTPKYSRYVSEILIQSPFSTKKEVCKVSKTYVNRNGLEKHSKLNLPRPLERGLMVFFQNPFERMTIGRCPAPVQSFKTIGLLQSPKRQDKCSTPGVPRRSPIQVLSWPVDA